MVETIRIGTRGSELALRQASWVGERILTLFPRLDIRFVTVRTKGDKILHSPLSMLGGKGLFVKEIEEALLAGRVDLAVHSIKDVPSEVLSGLVISAVPHREDPRDVLISRGGVPLARLPSGAKVGTSSLRRRAQLLRLRKDLQVVPVRGNVDTRMRKVDRGELDAIVLAAAAVRRLGLERSVTEFFSVGEFVPAVGQGALAVETRIADEAVGDVVAALDHEDSRLCVEAERSFLRHLGGGCQVPVGGHARKEGDQMELLGMVASLDGEVVFTERLRGPIGDGLKLGQELAERILQRGGKAILSSL